jgi:hypothetical protein
VLDANPDHKRIEEISDGIAAILNTDGDALPMAETALGLSPPFVAYNQTAGSMASNVFLEDDETSPIEARVDRVREWRQIAVRGASGVRFRSEVARVYDFRCLFTGQRLPKTEVTESAGVDAAHILPWSTHDLDSPRNGLCLSKLCHWALDAGVLQFSFDRQRSCYVLEVPDRLRTAAPMAGFDLGYFQQISGRIPSSRFPADRSLWPSPSYLDELNQFVFAE